jgi:membrane fusion protein (multidrug efflux system)
VELLVDAYPKRVFHGRVAGFSAGTGSILSLLPPENATGNFVKVVQRLTVRIDLTEPNPRDTPLFAGLSVEPEVDTAAKPTGPSAGERLNAAAPLPVASADAGAAR